MLELPDVPSEIIDGQNEESGMLAQSLAKYFRDSHMLVQNVALEFHINVVATLIGEDVLIELKHIYRKTHYND